IQFDSASRPIIVYLTSTTHEPDPHVIRQWTLARWTGDSWRITPITTSDHNYDFGQLYIESDAWRLIAPTDPGPQPNMTGGEIVAWLSNNDGVCWRRERAITSHSPRNHSFVRQPINAR